MKLKDKITEITAKLPDLGGDDPRRLARLIIKNAAKIDVSAQMADPDQTLTPAQIAAIDVMVARHLTGEPFSRTRGSREFYSLDFALSPGTLDPRPETEVVVDQALAWIKKRGEQGTDQPLTLLDLGTGTGCIPIAILKHAPHVRAVAVDLSPDALATAAANARTHGVMGRLALVQSDWFSGLSQLTFDLVVSNPPYIPASEVASLAKQVRDFDPILALAGGEDGLDPYRQIFADIHKYMKPGGQGLFEIGAGQSGEISRLATKSGLDVCGIWNDDAGIPRVVGVAVHK